MKTLLNVCMYSGMCHFDPQVILTQEQSDILLAKISSLNKHGKKNRFGTGVLGRDAFIVSFNAMDNFFEQQKYETDLTKCPHVFRITCHPGVIQVTMNTNPTEEMWWKEYIFEDTENIHDFLSELAEPAIATHIEDAQKRMDDHWASLGFGVKKDENLP